MDKGWIKLRNRILPEYLSGVEGFLSFSFDGLSLEDKVWCPCVRCKNLIKQNRKQIYEHCVMYGFLETYTDWRSHGNVSSNIHEDVEFGEDDEDDLDGMFQEALGYWVDNNDFEESEELRNIEIDGDTKTFFDVFRNTN